MNKKSPIIKIKKSVDNLLSRRPHRSFKLTKRRDNYRSLNIPGYWAFTIFVFKKLWGNRKLFLLLALVYFLATVMLIGLSSQAAYSDIADLLKATTGDDLNSFWGKIGGASLLLITSVSGGLSQSLTDIQQIYAGIIFLFIWLTTIWLLRNILANQKVKLRDGLYSSGSPILALFVIFVILMVQFLPIAIAAIIYNAASTTGLLSSGVEAMMAWSVILLLTTLSTYWLISTFFASIIVTLPGVYPMQAIKAAGDLVVGRRLRILMRLVWVIIITFVMWIIVMIPLILLNMWLSSLMPLVNNIPVIPMIIIFMSALTEIWIASYVYLLYRKVVEDESEPT